ncbi:MAG: hypothetical protein U0168_22510 [Nannocystaceae bacterium]
MGDCGGKQAPTAASAWSTTASPAPAVLGFTSCEWRCNKGQACPEGTSCTTIADGPGAVCR